MKTFLLISAEGDAWSLSKRLAEEGNHSIVYINDRSRRAVGDGLVEKSREGRVLINEGVVDEEVLKGVLHPKPDCIIFDMVEEGFGKLADQLSKSYPVIGLSSLSEKLEMDRVYGARSMKMMGINTPTTRAFTDYKEAIRFVEETNKPYVYKPSSNQATTTTYVAKGADDLIGILEHYSDIKEEFELQEKVSGIEISTELWFNGREVVSVNHTMEEKPLLEGNRGPKAGCLGSVVWTGNTHSKLYTEGVGKMVSALKKVEYRGPLDLNTIVTKDKLYGLEFTARFGYNALWVLLEMLKTSASDFMYGIASGAMRNLKWRAEWGLGVALVVPPYPLPVEPDLYRDVLINGIGEINSRHIWLYDAYKSNGKLLCAGCGGDICDITAWGAKVDSWSPLRDAKRRVMRTISNITIPDMMWRRDIGDRVPGEYEQLRSWGWIS